MAETPVSRPRPVRSSIVASGEYPCYEVRRPKEGTGGRVLDRRRFIQSVALAGSGTALVASRGMAFADSAPTTRRFVEQRWALDNIIRANGIDWDQPRSIYLSSPCGVEANADFAAIRSSVQKLADIGPAFESTARRREAKARAAENEGNAITARDNWYMAAIHYGAAEWPYDDSGKKHIELHELHQKKRECFANYARLADHKIEAVSIPFKGKSIPAWFHLPPGYSAGKVPVVIAIPGMDSFKETGVALANDRWMMRGAAVLAIDGPGQYESPLLGVYVSMQNWIDAAPVLVDWLSRRVEVDVEKIGVTGTSFGSFFGTILAANEPRIAATAVISTCLEPGCHTIFEEASPTFKKRFMWMSNYDDEAKFDEFVKTLTWEGHAERIRSPYLVVAGEADELSPLEYTERMVRVMTGPRQLVIYAGSRHSVGNVPAANLGPFPPILIADWLVARLNGKPFKSERWFVEPTGRIAATAL
jgi:dienelactone hydrolase